MFFHKPQRDRRQQCRDTSYLEQERCWDDGRLSIDHSLEPVGAAEPAACEWAKDHWQHHPKEEIKPCKLSALVFWEQVLAPGTGGDGPCR